MAHDRSLPDSPARPRSAARAATLEDIARTFVASDGRDARATAAFSDIGAAMLPRVDRSVAVAVARLIAGRDDVPEPVLAALAERGLRPRGARAAAPPAAPTHDFWSAPMPEAESEDPADDLAPSTHFLTADRATRDRMISEATRHGALDSGPELRRRIDSVSALALARAAERGDREDVAAILARVLSLTGARLLPLFDDPTGESLAVALRAAALEDDEAIRVFVGACGLRAQALRAAMAHFQTLERAAAARLLAGLTDESWSPRSAPRVPAQGQARREAASAAIFSPSLGRESGRPLSGQPHAGESVHSLSPNLAVEVRRQPR